MDGPVVNCVMCQCQCQWWTPRPSFPLLYWQTSSQIEKKESSLLCIFLPRALEKRIYSFLFDCTKLHEAICVFNPFPTALKKPSCLQSITLTTDLSDDISGSQLESSLPESTETVNTAAGVPMIQRCTYRHAYGTGLRSSLQCPECKEGDYLMWRLFQ